jgi:hypothetical protein
MHPLSKIIMVIAACSVLLAAGAANASGKPDTSEVRSAKVYSGSLDLSGNGRLLALGVYQDTDGEGRSSWRIVVNGKTTVRLPKTEDGLYGPTVTVTQSDLNGDKRPELMLLRYNTGSSGAKAIDVFEPSKAWRNLFSVTPEFESHDPAYLVRYRGNGKVSFVGLQTGMKAVIVVDKSHYGDSDAKVEKMLEGIETWIDPVQDYEFGDFNHNSYTEITTVRRVIGVSHADTIALLKRRYVLRHGHYEADLETLTDATGRKTIAVKTIKR